MFRKIIRKTCSLRLQSSARSQNRHLLMNIPPSILQRYGASLNRFAKNEYIFYENWPPHFYFQIEEGIVKMFNDGENNDFIQNMFAAGESFGEPPLFANFNYPADARAITDCKIWVLKKEIFINLLKENPDIHFEVTKTLAQRLWHKSHILNVINTKNPEQRILAIIDFFKNKSSKLSILYEVPFTRQALADMTGLRVETVIKKVIQLANIGELKIQDHKIFR